MLWSFAVVCSFGCSPSLHARAHRGCTDPAELPPFDVKRGSPPHLCQVEPLFPTRAAESGLGGWVRLQYDVGPDGRVISPRVLESEPARMFDQAALRAVSKWTYRRPVRNDEPTTYEDMVVVLRFMLEGRPVRTPSTEEVASFFPAWRVQISPDGERISAVRSDGKQTSLIVLRTATFEVMGGTQFPHGARVVHYAWDGTEGLLLQSSNHIVRLDSDGQNAESMTRMQMVRPHRVRPPLLLGRHPPGVPIGHGGVGVAIASIGGTADVSKVRVTPFQIDEAVADRDGNLRWAIAMRQARLELFAVDGETWIPTATVAPSARLLRYCDRERLLYFVGRDEANSPAVFSMAADGQRRKLAQREKLEPTGFVFDQADRLVAVEFFGSQPRLMPVRPESRLVKALLRLDEQFPNKRFMLSNTSEDGRLAIIESRADEEQPEYLLLDVHQHKAERLDFSFE